MASAVELPDAGENSKYSGSGQIVQALTIGQWVFLGGCLTLFAWCTGQLAAAAGMRYSFRYSSRSCVFDAMDGARRLHWGSFVVALVCAIAVFVFLIRLNGGSIS